MIYSRIVRNESLRANYIKRHRRSESRAVPLFVVQVGDIIEVSGELSEVVDLTTHVDSQMVTVFLRTESMKFVSIKMNSSLKVELFKSIGRLQMLLTILQ